MFDTPEPDAPEPLPLLERRPFHTTRFELANLGRQWEQVRVRYPRCGDLAEACHHLECVLDALTALLEETL